MKYIKEISLFFEKIFNVILYTISIVINFFLNVDYNGIFKQIKNFLAIGDKNLSLEMIGFEVTLISIYFIFLPFIIQDKKKEVYLGHNVSKWILYDRNKKSKFFEILSPLLGKDKKVSDMNVTFVFNILLVIISSVFYLLKLNLIVILLFFIFAIYLTKKVVTYLNLTSGDMCDNEIENNFLKLCREDKDKICSMLKDNTTMIIGDNKKTLLFILRHYDMENVEEAYKTFYSELIDRNDDKCNFLLFSEVSNEIYTRQQTGQCLDFHIQPWDLNELLKNDMNEINAEKMLRILSLIIGNNILLAKNDSEKYNEVLAISYKGILDNKIIGEETRNRLLNVILDAINYIDYPKSDNDFIKYKYIFNLFKYFIDTRDKNGLEFMLDNLSDNIDYREQLYSNILITIIIYLYYLIEIESPSFVHQDEKDFLNSLYPKIKQIVSTSNLKYYYYNDVDVLFDWVNNISHFWERFDFKNGTSSCCKTPMVDSAIITSKRALYILFKRDAINNVKINNNDLNVFKFCIEDETLKAEVLNDVKKFIGFMGIPLESNTLENYIRELIEYASINARSIPKDEKNIKYFIDNFKVKEKELYQKMSKLEIFNSSNVDNSQKFYINLTSEKELLDAYTKQNFLKWVDLDNIIEKKILDIFSNKELSKVEYSYNSEKNILKKLKLLKKPYYYIRPIYDNLGEQFKFGNEYLDCISKFKIVNVSTGNKRFIVDDYKCELKSIKFEVRELNEKELKYYIKKHKRGKFYYIKDDYGFDIKYSKEEAMDYFKNKYAFCILVFEIGVDIDNTKGYKFVYKKEDAN